MKRILTIALIALIALIAVVAANARDRRVSYTDLPTAAQTFIEKNFGKNSVNHVKMDGRDFDVILNNGTELEFDRQGKVLEIDCGKKGVPSKVVPTPIQNYTKKYLPKQKITKIEWKRNGNIEVEMTDGIDIVFDSAGNFLRYDD